jgi:predicted enzyme related to lactoylglutathione lyase
MPNNVGKFIWYDAMTSDMKAAEAFYSSVIGWQAKDSGMSDRPYTILSAGPDMIGGLMPIPDDVREMGGGPAWTGYVFVDDVDAGSERVKAAGGGVLRPPADIPGIGRFSVVADPHGAVFILFHSVGAGEGGSLDSDAPGHVGWRELHAGDGEAAFAFYSGLFGWTKDLAHDMGPMGVYQTFTIGGGQSGGMMTKMPQTPAPFWLYYFNVEAIDAAKARAEAGGGTVINGPMQVPGGRWIVQCLDPQGAMFAMVAPQR